MFGKRRHSQVSPARRVARVAAGGLLVSSMFVAAASVAFAAPAAGGNNGTVKLGSAGVPFTNANDPHLTCPIQIQWSGFDPGTQTFDVAFSPAAPTGGTVTPTGNLHGTFSAQPWVEQYSLSFTGSPNHNGEFHVGVTVTTTASTGQSDIKNKTVWVAGCAAPPSALTLSAACSATVAGQADWTITNASGNPAVSSLTVASANPAGLNPTPTPTTLAAGNTGTATFSTPAPLAAGQTLTASGSANGTPVSSNALGFTQTCTMPGANPLVLTAACSPNNPGHADWTITNANGNPQVTGLTVASANPAGLNPTPSSTTLAANNGTATFTTTVPLGAGQTLTASGTAGANPVSSNALGFTATCQPQTVSALTLSAACSPNNPGHADWTITNANGNPQVTSLTVTSNPTGVTPTLSSTTLAANTGTATFSTLVPLGTGQTLTASGDANGTPVSSNALGFAGTCSQGQPETPATVAYTDTCTAIQVVFTSADQHSTVFDVTTPLGGSDTVTGDATRSYPADANDRHIQVQFDGNTSNHTWSLPAGCVAPGQADPQVSGTNKCKTGINLVLSNVNGTADTAFLVTAPDGSTSTVGVRAGQLKRVSYAVAEDTTGVVTVRAPGLATKTFTYNKNCTKVLGEKHVRKPPTKVVKPVVQGEKQTLPFTGFDAQRALLYSAAMLFLGAVFCGLAARRRVSAPGGR